MNFVTIEYIEKIDAMAMDSMRTERLLNKLSENEILLRHRAQDVNNIEACLRNIVMDLNRNELDSSKVPAILKILDNVSMNCKDIRQAIDRIDGIIDGVNLKKKEEVTPTASDYRRDSESKTVDPIQEQGADSKKVEGVTVVSDTDSDSELSDGAAPGVELNPGQLHRLPVGRRDRTSADSGIASTGSSRFSLPQDPQAVDEPAEAVDMRQRAVAAGFNDLNRLTGNGTVPESLEDNEEAQSTERPMDSAAIIPCVRDIDNDNRAVLNTVMRQRTPRGQRLTESKIPQDPSTGNI